MLSKMTVSHSPHISKPMSTRSVMVDVVISLVPAMLAAAIFFRARAVVLLVTCVIACALTEWLCNLARKVPKPWESLGDFSAVLTGIILALSLPPRLPVWTAVIGSAFAIAIGKMVFGGLGANVFNPAMVGRTFLTASFGALMTTWTVPATFDPAMPDVAFTDQIVDARTTATPLGKAKEAIKERKKSVGLAAENETAAAQQALAVSKAAAETVNSQLTYTLTGEVAGCLGETSALALILGGIYLLIRKTITFHTPAAVLVSAFLFGAVVYAFNPTTMANPLTHLLSGGMLMCAFFIATDPVTAPLTRRGMWIFGAGVGLLIMLIRVVGEYPEGVMFAILLMNAVTPLIDRLCKRSPAGGVPHVQG
ncbi:MAG: RnfABCDGE type electron transport complex subunit D [Phycisphaerae bacterium]|nr:RnfABCDGE type electron transport complex subunit D [Phycisphaerae bacterium]